MSINYILPSCPEFIGTGQVAVMYTYGGKKHVQALNAIKNTPACKTLYERLSANGKTGKHVLIAV